MSIDGITLHALCDELNEKITDSHIKKIAQPEKEELIITCSKDRTTRRLLISALPSLPVCYLTEENKQNPITAPNFCMLLRKYLNGGKIASVSQVGMERVLKIVIEHLNELGDPAKKSLYVEIMGKHSNIILCDENDRIIDAIKHVPSSMSSVREVLPGRDYFIPRQEGHFDLFSLTKEDFYEDIVKRPLSIRKMIFSAFTGFGPVMAEEICHRLGIDSDASVLSLSKWQQDAFYEELLHIKEDLLHKNYHPVVILEPQGQKPLEVYPFALGFYGDKESISYDSISEALVSFYAVKNLKNNMDQKTFDLRKTVNNLLDRNRKKLMIQKNQLKDADSMEKFRLYGELLTANAYALSQGKKAEVLNYYTNETISIPLDETMSVMDNANRYYNKYNKLKRTVEASKTLIKETEDAISHLESIMTAISIAEDENDLLPIRAELYEYGFTKKRPGEKKGAPKKSKPLHFVTEDGYEIYVGKNNYQNEEVTFKIATGNDWWFHSKTIPGSHVIVRSNNRELPDHIFEIAAELAGYYSNGRDQDKIDIDYIQKKHIKKVAGAAPGYVIYHTNYSMTVRPQKRGVRIWEAP